MVYISVVARTHVFRADIHGVFDAREDGGAAGVECPVEVFRFAVGGREVREGGEEVLEGRRHDGGGEFGDAGRQDDFPAYSILDMLYTKG